MAVNTPLILLLALFVALFHTSHSKTVFHTFNVANTIVTRLCRQQTITAVNGSLPGPAIFVDEGDTLVVDVHNNSPYNTTIHWHGIFQLLSGWADGPEYITQCPIQPGNTYTYRFNIIGQEGTLWWHAHVQWLRATVHGALIIRSPPHRIHTFPLNPVREVPILLGEWWNANVIDVENAALASGGGPNISDAFTINGLPGDFYPCSQNQTYRLDVMFGNTYLLRLINAALNNQLFFMIAGHNLTVVAIDASYAKPYVTDVVVLAPGQTADVLFTANQPPAAYYMAARAYASASGVAFDNTTTRGLVVYNNVATSSPISPLLPAYNDTKTANRFYTSLRGLVTGPFWRTVPSKPDHSMFVTMGLGLVPCGNNTTTCQGPLGQRLAASMNNESFVIPTKMSILEALFKGVNTIYNLGFPDTPAVKFNYTDPSIAVSQPLVMTNKSTLVKGLKYNDTVQVVLQNTAFIGIENHPIHLHGFNFRVLAQGFGNYDPVQDPKSFNFVDPQSRNTIAVPAGGWAVIVFQANNPGVWFFHCHLDVHLPWGLATAFVVENGPTTASTLPPPPKDFPTC